MSQQLHKILRTTGMKARDEEAKEVGAVVVPYDLDALRESLRQEMMQLTSPSAPLVAGRVQSRRPPRPQ